MLQLKGITKNYLSGDNEVKALKGIDLIIIEINGILCQKAKKGGDTLIDYSPFWETLKKTNENWYTLTSKHHMSHSTLHRLKHNQDISMKTVNDLCRILHCQIQDICVYVPSDEDQPL